MIRQVRLAADPRFQPYARQKQCVWIDVANIDDLAEIRPLVLESYRLNAPAEKEQKKTRRGTKTRMKQ